MERTLFEVMDQFQQMKVLVIGEAILESYVKGSADRLTLEAPAPVVDHAVDQRVPGGAASAALNAAALGAEVTFLSVTGRDSEAEDLLQALRDRGILVSGVMRLPDRSTLLRRRIFSGERLLVRYDQGSTDSISRQAEDLLLGVIRQFCQQADVILLSDYGAGLFTPRLLEGIERIQREHECLFVADTRRLEAFSGVPLAAVRSSDHSALDLLGGPRPNGDSTARQRTDRLSEAGEKILRQMNAQAVVITIDDGGALALERGEAGASTSETGTAGERPSGAGGRNDMIYRTYAPDMPFNHTDGAGDAFVAGMALALAAGTGLPAAAEIASAVASTVVRRGGLSACCPEDIRFYLEGDEKLLGDRVTLAERVAYLRRQGKKIVFTNGCFDILHSGHVSYLNQAKAFGDVLIIGVNTDESVSRLKGPERPINNLEERMKVLAGLSCVDLLIAFGENTPVELIKIVKPDVYVKGGDYTRETLPEAPVVERLGGTIELVPFIQDRSTSRVIKKIRQAE